MSFSRQLEAYSAMPDDTTLLKEQTRLDAVESFTWLHKSCTSLGLRASSITARKLVECLSEANFSSSKVRDLSEDLQHRLMDELSETLFFSLDIDESQRYMQFRKNWEEIIDRFPDTITDIEESQKCFALSRYSASVFHSLEVVEIGLIDVCKFLSVPDPNSGWTAAAGALKKVINKTYNDRTEFEKLHFSHLEQIQGTVEALKNAWRNKISHAQGKLRLMTKDFSREVAEEIIFATSGPSLSNI